MTDQRIEPGQTIGILGGGQLGRMMALAAKAMGYRTATLEPKADSPCAQVSDTEVIADYTDRNGAARLAALSDVLTYEFENIDSDTASWLEWETYLPQGGDLLAITQDRWQEKKAVRSFGVPTVPYKTAETADELQKAVEELGTPCVMKTARGGYDGKGQQVITDRTDLTEVWSEMEASRPFVIEAWIPFKAEVSVVVTRTAAGEAAAFPPAENIHKNGILHTSIVPARLEPKVIDHAKKTALLLAESFHLIGTLAVEMFVTDDGFLYVNELAPRPHNSGHYTIEACETSQFEQHIRAICGLPLGPAGLLKPAVMVNILGQHVQKAREKRDLFPDGHWHEYGKDEAKQGRKMGHVTVLTDDVAGTLKRLDQSGIWRNDT
ncbi:5-(carboxyamino)imidazole ribonucleotide synthase [Salisediminibacterium halotolerans]|uniref:5-(carboxyamino)imidazole ribonucleotide synthase n=1 Tax=Salisediminibacterium halotolerans TaxID=517425 RepID=UPI000EABD553|nr:5-(carboxyamino)imidazole ribonucleotide synthase [Salisediminibacterium halotolerans]RLJ71759.1 5-(carboxyamino)imidazole ribonucleotide synthase [Actinophytocola xinjiangensis]RPE86909.1 5-(carboxyamino)imidazole ribonucleotide synthase [Salisediminibacterium halotolerans]TWG32972.1 5-(carboxyamino)imidazole ribonucleotide synthase [Salisediminibacterium halotolerans]GEL08574.1 N5-carboxyaminoimidazole ribonucleotide synthase [Salisediminibacterium halotolerans]